MVPHHPERGESSPHCLWVPRRPSTPKCHEQVSLAATPPIAKKPIHISRSLRFKSTILYLQSSFRKVPSETNFVIAKKNLKIFKVALNVSSNKKYFNDPTLCKSLQTFSAFSDHSAPPFRRQGTTVEAMEKPIVFKISAWAILTTCQGNTGKGLNGWG